MIYTKEHVRESVELAFLEEPQAGMESAIHATAQALGLDVETVQECVDEDSEAVL